MEEFDSRDGLLIGRIVVDLFDPIVRIEVSVGRKGEEYLLILSAGNELRVWDLESNVFVSSVFLGNKPKNVPITQQGVGAGISVSTTSNFHDRCLYLFSRVGTTAIEVLHIQHQTVRPGSTSLLGILEPKASQSKITPITSISVHPHLPLLAAGTADGTVTVWYFPLLSDTLIQLANMDIEDNDGPSQGPLLESSLTDTQMTSHSNTSGSRAETAKNSVSDYSVILFATTMHPSVNIAGGKLKKNTQENTVIPGVGVPEALSCVMVTTWHPTLPLLAAIDGSGHMVVWRVGLEDGKHSVIASRSFCVPGLSQQEGHGRIATSILFDATSPRLTVVSYAPHNPVKPPHIACWSYAHVALPPLPCPVSPALYALLETLAQNPTFVLTGHLSLPPALLTAPTASGSKYPCLWFGNTVIPFSLLHSDVSRHCIRPGDDQDYLEYASALSGDTYSTWTPSIEASWNVYPEDSLLGPSLPIGSTGVVQDIPVADIVSVPRCWFVDGTESEKLGEDTETKEKEPKSLFGGFGSESLADFAAKLMSTTDQPNISSNSTAESIESALKPLYPLKRMNKATPTCVDAVFYIQSVQAAVGLPIARYGRQFSLHAKMIGHAAGETPEMPSGSIAALPSRRLAWLPSYGPGGPLVPVSLQRSPSGRYFLVRFVYLSGMSPCKLAAQQALQQQKSDHDGATATSTSKGRGQAASSKPVDASSKRRNARKDAIDPNLLQPRRPGPGFLRGSPSYDLENLATATPSDEFLYVIVGPLVDRDQVYRVPTKNPARSQSGTSKSNAQPLSPSDMFPRNQYRSLPNYVSVSELRTAVDVSFYDCDRLLVTKRPEHAHIGGAASTEYTVSLEYLDPMPEFRVTDFPALKSVLPTARKGTTTATRGSKGDSEVISIASEGANTDVLVPMVGESKDGPKLNALQHDSAASFGGKQDKKQGDWKDRLLNPLGNLSLGLGKGKAEESASISIEEVPVEFVPESLSFGVHDPISRVFVTPFSSPVDALTRVFPAKKQSTPPPPLVTLEKEQSGFVRRIRDPYYDPRDLDTLESMEDTTEIGNVLLYVTRWEHGPPAEHGIVPGMRPTRAASSDGLHVDGVYGASMAHPQSTPSHMLPNTNRFVAPVGERQVLRFSNNAFGMYDKYNPHGLAIVDAYETTVPLGHVRPAVHDLPPEALRASAANTATGFALLGSLGKQSSKNAQQRNAVWKPQDSFSAHRIGAPAGFQRNVENEHGRVRGDSHDVGGSHQESHGKPTPKGDNKRESIRFPGVESPLGRNKGTASLDTAASEPPSFTKKLEDRKAQYWVQHQNALLQCPLSIRPALVLELGEKVLRITWQSSEQVADAWSYLSTLSDVPDATVPPFVPSSNMEKTYRQRNRLSLPEAISRGGPLCAVLTNQRLLIVSPSLTILVAIPVVAPAAGEGGPSLDKLTSFSAGGKHTTFAEKALLGVNFGVSHGVVGAPLSAGVPGRDTSASVHLPNALAHAAFATADGNVRSLDSNSKSFFSNFPYQISLAPMTQLLVHLPRKPMSSQKPNKANIGQPVLRTQVSSISEIRDSLSQDESLRTSLSNSSLSKKANRFSRALSNISPLKPSTSTTGTPTQSTTPVTQLSFSGAGSNGAQSHPVAPVAAFVSSSSPSATSAITGQPLRSAEAQVLTAIPAAASPGYGLIPATAPPNSLDATYQVGFHESGALSAAASAWKLSSAPSASRYTELSASEHVSEQVVSPMPWRVPITGYLWVGSALLFSTGNAIWSVTPLGRVFKVCALDQDTVDAVPILTMHDRLVFASTGWKVPKVLIKTRIFSPLEPLVTATLDHAALRPRLSPGLLVYGKEYRDKALEEYDPVLKALLNTMLTTLVFYESKRGQSGSLTSDASPLSICSSSKLLSSKLESLLNLSDAPYTPYVTVLCDEAAITGAVLGSLMNDFVYVQDLVIRYAHPNRYFPQNPPNLSTSGVVSPPADRMKDRDGPTSHFGITPAVLTALEERGLFDLAQYLVSGNVSGANKDPSGNTTTRYSQIAELPEGLLPGALTDTGQPRSSVSLPWEQQVNLALRRGRFSEAIWLCVAQDPTLFSAVVAVSNKPMDPTEEDDSEHDAVGDLFQAPLPPATAKISSLLKMTASVAVRAGAFREALFAYDVAGDHVAYMQVLALAACVAIARVLQSKDAESSEGASKRSRAFDFSGSGPKSSKGAAETGSSVGMVTLQEVRQVLQELVSSTAERMHALAIAARLIQQTVLEVEFAAIESQKNEKSKLKKLKKERKAQMAQSSGFNTDAWSGSEDDNDNDDSASDSDRSFTFEDPVQPPPPLANTYTNSAIARTPMPLDIGTGRTKLRVEHLMSLKYALVQKTSKTMHETLQRLSAPGSVLTHTQRSYLRSFQGSPFLPLLDTSLRHALINKGLTPSGSYFDFLPLSHVLPNVAFVGRTFDTVPPPPLPFPVLPASFSTLAYWTGAQYPGKRLFHSTAASIQDEDGDMYGAETDVGNVSLAAMIDLAMGGGDNSITDPISHAIQMAQGQKRLRPLPRGIEDGVVGYWRFEKSDSEAETESSTRGQPSWIVPSKQNAEMLSTWILAVNDLSKQQANGYLFDAKAILIHTGAIEKHPQLMTLFPEPGVNLGLAASDGPFDPGEPGKFKEPRVLVFNADGAKKPSSLVRMESYLPQWGNVNAILSFPGTDLPALQPSASLAAFYSASRFCTWASVVPIQRFGYLDVGCRPFDAVTATFTLEAWTKVGTSEPGSSFQRSSADAFVDEHSSGDGFGDSDAKATYTDTENVLFARTEQIYPQDGSGANTNAPLFRYQWKLFVRRNGSLVFQAFVSNPHTPLPPEVPTVVTQEVSSEAGTVPYGQWVHVALVVDASAALREIHSRIRSAGKSTGDSVQLAALPKAQIRLYRDGEEVADGSIIPRMPLPLPGDYETDAALNKATPLTDLLLLGPDLTGRMSEVRLWLRKRSEGELNDTKDFPLDLAETKRLNRMNIFIRPATLPPSKPTTTSAFGKDSSTDFGFPSSSPGLGPAAAPSTDFSFDFPSTSSATSTAPTLSTTLVAPASPSLSRLPVTSFSLSGPAPPPVPRPGGSSALDRRRNRMVGPASTTATAALSSASPAASFDKDAFGDSIAGATDFSVSFPEASDTTAADFTVSFPDNEDNAVAKEATALSATDVWAATDSFSFDTGSTVSAFGTQNTTVEAASDASVPKPVPDAPSGLSLPPKGVGGGKKAALLRKAAAGGGTSGAPPTSDNK